MNASPTLYEIHPDGDRLAVDPVWTQGADGPIPAGTAHLVPITAADGPDLLAVAPDGNTTVLRVEGKEPYLEPVAGRIDLGGPWDTVRPVSLANVPHVLAYRRSTGEISVTPVPDGRHATPPFVYQRKHDPGRTAGFDFVQPVTVDGDCHLLCYRGDTGDVAIHTLRILVSSPPGAQPGAPPLAAQPTWIHQWAPDWTRFAFFTLGGEAYFLKTNTGKLNVNIDHILDDPAAGTVEVGTYLHLDDALELDLCQSFAVDGDPHFAAHRPDGATVLYRVRGDCQGWTARARLDAPAGTTTIVPLAAGGSQFLLFA